MYHMDPSAKIQKPGKNVETLGNAHKYVWLVSPDRLDFWSRVQAGGSTSTETEK